MAWPVDLCGGAQNPAVLLTAVPQTATHSTSELAPGCRYPYGRFNAPKSGSRMSPVGRQFQFGRSTCGHTACLRCRRARRDLGRPLWSMRRPGRVAGLCRLYLETGRWRLVFRKTSMTGSGRLRVQSRHPRATAECVRAVIRARGAAIACTAADQHRGSWTRSRSRPVVCEGAWMDVPNGTCRCPHWIKRQSAGRATLLPDASRGLTCAFIWRLPARCWS
jgi:hypothetical protein